MVIRTCIRLIVVWCVMAASVASAQVTTADLVGRIADSSGAVLPGATVTVQSEATRVVRTTVASGTGDYVFNLLQPGAYSVQIELEGFQTQKSRVVLSAGDRSRLDVKMQLGSLSESVTVAAQATLVQTDSSSLSSLITQTAVQDLPIVGRNVVRLVQLMPGANEGLANSFISGARPDDRRQTSAISVNGANDNQNNQLIDGADNNERAMGSVGVKPSIDAISEVKVQTNLYSAEVGRTAGGVINLITKSGSNMFHGTGFEFFRDTKFDGKDYFATKKPEFRQNQFGGSLGGPVVKDRTFFFGDFEGLRLRQGVPNVFTVPTMKMRNGDFSELSGLIYDPTSPIRTPFSGNVIPVNRMDPIGRVMMLLYPEPTSPGLANNYAATTLRTQESNTADVRIDHHFNETNSVFARYSLNDVNTYTPAGCDALPNGIQPGCGGALAFPGQNNTRVHNLQSNYTRIHNSTLISEFKVAYTNLHIGSFPVNYGNDVAKQLGIQNVNVDVLTSGLSNINPAGYATLGDATFLPIIHDERSVQIAGSMTKTHDAHNIKFGAGMVLRKFKLIQNAQGKGLYTFSGQPTDNGSGVGGNSIASMLLGFPTQVQRGISLVEPVYHTNEPSLYVQDDWRVKPWLTLNVGIRYDVFTPFTEEKNQISNFDFSAAKIIVAGQDGVSETAGIATDHSNVAPRFGAAITLPGGAVVRGGWGLTYFPGNFRSQAFLKNQPFVSVYGPIVSAASSGGVPTIQLSTPWPVVVPSSNINPAGGIVAVEQNFKATRVQQFNVMIEKEFAGNVVQAGYLGTRGDHVADVATDMNLAPAGPGAVQPRRRYASVLPNVTQIQLFASEFNSRYDAMQLVFQRRMLEGLTFNTNYTLAHNTRSLWNPIDVSITDWYDADLDIRHRWAFSGNYELPFGRSSTGAAKYLLSGWQVNAVAFYQTGTPFDVVNAAPRANTGLPASNGLPGSGFGERPNLVGDPTISNPSPTAWFNTAAFAAQPNFTMGNSPKNPLHGPPMRRLDLSVFKDFRLTAAARLQVRVECYNITDTPSFANPNGQFGSASFGTITSTGNNIPRQMQFGAKLLF